MDEKPKRKDINKYVKPHVADKWFDIGLELVVGDEDGKELEQIKDKLKTDRDCFDAMIVKWLKEADPGVLTWRTLLSALEVYGATEAVRAVKEHLFKESVEEEVTSGASPPKHTEASSQPTQDTTGDQPAEETVNTTDTDRPTTPDNAEGSLSTITDQQELDLATVDEGDIVRPKSTHKGLDDTPLSIEGPELPLLTSPSALDFDLELGKDQQGQESRIRDYQQELADLGTQGKNYIVVAPTGTGKTLVAAIVISDHLQKGKETDETRRVAFIVETKPLAHQQAKEIKEIIPAAKVSCCVGDETSFSVKSSLEQGDHIVVCTAGKFFNELKNGRLTLNDFSLLVFDECHHTRKHSPYAELMIRYLKMKVNKEKLPQIMGLTASPGAGNNPHLEKFKSIDHLTNLCALMDATSGIKIVKDHQMELDQHSNKPEGEVIYSKPRDQNEPLIVKIVELMKELEKTVGFSCSYDRWTQEYDSQVQTIKKELENSQDPESRSKNRVWQFLRCLNRALEVYMELQFNDCISELQKFESKLLEIENPIPLEKRLLEKISTLIISLEQQVFIENPHLRIVEEILTERFQHNKDMMVMLFVRTKKHATAIHSWLESLPIAGELGIKPEKVVGQEGGTTGEGMTQAKQGSAIKSFGEHRCNVLVATSIAEEGIDVPACNLVIRYQHVTNEIAKLQSTGRARAKDSECITILSSELKQRQEAMNSELLALVEKILQDGHLPRGELLKKYLFDEQKKILKKHKLENEHCEQRKYQYRPEDVELFCKNCQEPACNGSEIRLLNEINHVVPGERFREKVKFRPHETPRMLGSISVTEKIYCQKCNESWGNCCTWPKQSGKFPTLKCKSFTFIAKGTIIAVSKWSQAPFEIKPIEADIEL